MSLAEGFLRRRGYFTVSAAIVLCDQLAKLAADAWLKGQGPVSVIPGFLNLWYSRNRGGLFGSFGGLEDPWRLVLLLGLPLAFVVGMTWFLARTDEPDRSTLFGLASMLGGACGNLIDRLFRGEVVDFLDVYASHERLAAWLVHRFGTVHWPTFNLADSAIVVGACLLLLDVVRPERKPAPAGERRA